MRIHQGTLFNCLQILFSFCCFLAQCEKASTEASHLVLSHSVFTAAEGSAVHVTCTAFLKEKPQSLRWISRQRENVSQLNDEKNHSVKLVIPSLHRNDAGTYTCILVTVNGKEEKAELRILVRSRDHDRQTCRVTQFKCKVTKYCIFLRYRCDGKDDCGDGSDEECSGDPCANKFLCNNTRCVSHNLLCDHVDHCGDNSDERSCSGPYILKGYKAPTTVDPSKAGIEDDDNYGWVKSTIYTIIAITIGLVILISIVVILVFRAKMKRVRERRIVHNPLNPMQMFTGSDESRLPIHVEQQPFIPQTGQQFHQGPSIIFNVNNGVQYMSRYNRYFPDNPPPYSEVQRNEPGSGPTTTSANTPPPYSTVDRCGEGPLDQAHSIRGRYEGFPPDMNPIARDNIPNTNRNSLPQTRIENANGVSSHREMSSPSTHQNIGGLSRSERGSGIDLPGPSFTQGCDLVAERGLGSELIPSLQGVDINSQFLHNLLVSHGSRGSTTDSESCSNGSVACSSSSSGDDGACRGLIVPETSSKNSIHEAETLRTRNQEMLAYMADPTELDCVPSSFDIGVCTPCDQDLSLGQTSCESDRLIPDVLPAFDASNCDTEIDSLLDAGTSEIVPCEESYENPHTAAPTGEACDNRNQMNAPSDGCPAIPHVVDSFNQNNSLLSGGSGDASSALLQEVARIDERNKPKKGHLSVHRGQIVLHTEDGILAGQAAPPDSGSDQASAPLSPHLSGEIIVKDGNIMLQIPVGKSLSSTGHIGFPSSLSKLCPKDESLSLDSTHDNEDSTPLASSQTKDDDMVTINPQPSPTRMEGDLNIRDGQLVLDPPRHTPSSQILAHLHGAYSQEQKDLSSSELDEVSAVPEPVINDKRAAGTSGPRQQTPKCKLDIVLPMSWK